MDPGGIYTVLQQQTTVQPKGFVSTTATQLMELTKTVCPAAVSSALSSDILKCAKIQRTHVLWKTNRLFMSLGCLLWCETILNVLLSDINHFFYF